VGKSSFVYLDSLLDFEQKKKKKKKKQKNKKKYFKKTFEGSLSLNDFARVTVANASILRFECLRANAAASLNVDRA